MEEPQAAQVSDDSAGTAVPAPPPAASGPCAGQWRFSLLAAAALCLPVLLRTGATLLRPSDTLPGLVKEDQLGQVWLFWWAGRSLLDGWGDFLHTTYLNFPGGVPTLTGFGFIAHAMLALPLLRWLEPVAAVNLFFAATLLWSAACVYLLCRDIAGSRAAAVACALLCALSPWSLDRMELLGMSSEFFELGSFALCLLGLRRARLTRRRLPALLAGAAFALAFWTEAHHGVYLALTLLVLAARDLARPAPGASRRGELRRYLLFAAPAAALSLPWALVLAGTFLTHSPVLGPGSGPGALPSPGGLPGDGAGAMVQGVETLLGGSLVASVAMLCALVVGAALLTRGDRSRQGPVFWFGLALAGAVISSGTELLVPSGDDLVHLPLPFRLMQKTLPLLGRDLWPDRWFQLSLVALSVGLAHCWRVLALDARLPRSRRALALAAALAALYGQQHLHSVGTAPAILPPGTDHVQLWSRPAARPLPPMPPWLSRLRAHGPGAAPVLHLPLNEIPRPGQDKSAYWLAQTLHQRPVVNRLVPGVLARQRDGERLEQAMRLLDRAAAGQVVSQARVADMLRRLKDAGVAYVLVHRGEGEGPGAERSLGVPEYSSPRVSAYGLTNR